MDIKKVVLFVIVICAAAYAFMSGCGVTTSGGSSTTTATTTATTTFYTNASATAPVFKPSSTSSSSTQGTGNIAPLTTSWESGNPLYSVFFSLREYLATRDAGVVDRSNIYKVIADVDSVFSGISATAASIEEQAINPPFSGLGSVTCNKAVNNTTDRMAIAMKETTGEIDAIITWIWPTSTSSPTQEYGIATVRFNTITKDLTIDMTYSVDYNLADTLTTYNLRCYVTGNAATNTFEFKYIINDTKIVAKGVSRGAGNYMLIKYVDSSTTKYIVVPGTADEDYFKAQNTSPTDIYTDPNLLPSTVSSYKSWVESTAFFTASDLVTDISTLNSGNSKAGTIYINYN